MERLRRRAPLPIIPLGVQSRHQFYNDQKATRDEHRRGGDPT